LENLFEQSLRSNDKAGTDLVLVGGTSVDRPRIEAAFPQMRIHHFRVAHVAQNGSVTTFPAAKSVDLERRLSHISYLSRAEEQQLADRAERDALQRRTDQSERAKFFRLMKKTPARTTSVILFFIALVFIAEVIWFGNTRVALAFGDRSAEQTQDWLMFTIGMGALYAPLVDAGQWWRMLSAGFLHHGLMHVAVNSFALFILGRQLEKVLGGFRFIIIYTAALLGGSIGSYLLTDGVSAGASGAIWGLLGAQVSLAYGRPPVLPQSVAAAIRPLAIQNVFLNVAISLVPGIDWAAHFGGGLAGGLLLASGLLYPSDSSNRLPRRVRILAYLCAVILLGGVCVTLLAGYLSSQT
jgi:membrane associated rhomboid family serine protease